MGIIILMSGIPAAFIASSSSRSPKLPNVMSDASSMASGRASLTRVMEQSEKNCIIMVISSPLPTNSSTDLHNICIMKIKRHIRNVPDKSWIKLFIMNKSSFLIMRKCGNFIIIQFVFHSQNILGLMLEIEHALLLHYAKIMQGVSNTKDFTLFLK